MIRRTRQFIKKAYPEATTDGKKIHFPERKLLTVRYDLEGTYRGIYDKVVRNIEGLRLAPYELETYKADPKTRDPLLVGRGQALVGIFKSRYLKRLESSIAAFRISIFRLMEYLYTFRHYILAGVLLEPTDFWKLLGTIERDLEDDARAQEEEEEEDGDSTASRKPQSRHKEIEANPKARALLKQADRLPPETYDVQVVSDALDADLSALDTIYDLVRPIKPEADKKLLRLRQMLTKELAGRKVLIFTSYKDTAAYLYRQIAQDPGFMAQLGDHQVRVIHGGSKGEARQAIVQGFAPKSNDRPEWAGTDKEIDILLSTDVLSEGQNLQDCAYLVNYDLHWNPTRMIQRAGRIDRIGTEFDTLYVRNFFPDEGLERLLGLVQALQAKIQNIDATLGLDASVLGEAINPKVFNTLKRIEDQDASVMDEEEAEAELASDEGLARRLAEYIKNAGSDVLRELPDGIHSGIVRHGYRGVFLYYQLTGPTPANTEHFWRSYEFASGSIDDNRLALADLIRCKPEEPRVVDPALKAEIYKIMEAVESQILQSLQHQESIQTAPRELSGDQSVVLVALQQLLSRPELQRQRVMTLLAALSQPLLGAPVKELKKSLQRFQKTGDPLGFLAACEETASKYTPQPNPAAQSVPNQVGRSFTREDLHLICYEFLS